MGILDSVRKNIEEKKKHTTPAVEGHALAEVLKDKSKSDLFGKLLEREGKKDLGERLAKNELEEGDVETLEELRKTLSEKITRAEETEKLLTKESVIDFARNNPDFEKVVNQLTPEGAIKVIVSQLKEISITDEDRFNTIASLLKSKESYRNGGYKETEKEVEELLNKKGITSKEFQDAIAIEDQNKKEEALKELANRTNTFFKRSLYSLSSGKWGKDTTLEELKESAESIKNSIANLDTVSSSIGLALFMSVNENKDIRKAYSNELTGEKSPNESKKGFKEAKNEAYDETDLKKEWEELKKKQPNPGYKNLDIGRKEALRGRFINEQVKAHKDSNEGGGFWARIFQAFFEKKIEDNREKFEL